MSSPRSRALPAVGIGLAVVTALLAGAICLQVARRYSDGPDTEGWDFAALALVALLVIGLAFLIPAALARLDVQARRWLPWLVGAASALVALVAWWMVWSSATLAANPIYEALHLPQGRMQFWDLTLVVQSIECSSFGFDVYQANNGCLADPSIYAPGSLWLKYVPFDLFTQSRIAGLGIAAIVVSSLMLVWLARTSAGLGAVVLLVAALGAPWQLMLERANVDMAVMWCAVVAVILVRRWNGLWAWYVAAALIWLAGTWKYYPFAMGLMLLPALRLRRGWTVLLAFALAVAAFMAATWQNFMFSAQSNTNMVQLYDLAVLGRVPVVARMAGSLEGAGLQLGTLLFLALAASAAAWGAVWAWRRGSRRARPDYHAMLAVAGSSVFLGSVLLAGFGWAYKAAFLLLLVPMLARRSGIGGSHLRSTGFHRYSALVMLALVAVASLVMVNTVLATTASVLVASFGLGASLVLLMRPLVHKQTSQGD